jgi:TonB family protein
MGQITKSSFVLSMLIICMNVTGQNRGNDILSDTAKFAEYIYINMHYPLMDLINNVEGTAVYKFEFDSIKGINEIRTINSSGSGSLDREGRRLLLQIPIQRDEYPTHEISINFKLADNKIYEMSEVSGEEIPEFPGGNAEMVKFISQNLNWPREGAEMGIQGSIICGFVIEKDGSINIVEIVRPLQRWFDAETMRVIKRMPKWTAGKKDGKPVRVYFIVPVRIQLQ